MRSRTVLLVVMTALALSGSPSAAAAPPAVWLRPVAGPVARPFQAPISRFGRGHLGVDFAAAPGTLVRAAAVGTVVFAGVVANARHVVVRHADGRRTSYSFLATITVRRGDVVARGEELGTTGGVGENHDGRVLHFGLRVGATFVDPMSLFTTADLVLRVHLAPLGAGERGRTRRVSGAHPREASALLAGLGEAPPVVLIEPPEPGPGPTRPG